MYNKTIVPIDMVKKSISLKNIGINELAWYGKDAIEAIEYLSKLEKWNEIENILLNLNSELTVNDVKIKYKYK